MDDEIQGRIDRINELDSEALAALKADIKVAIREANSKRQAGEDGALETMRALKGHHDAIEQRESELAEADEIAALAEEQPEPEPTPEPEPQPEPTAEEESTETEEEAATEQPEGEAETTEQEEEPEAVAASVRPDISDINARRPQDRVPQPKADEVPQAITASADLGKDFSVGQKLEGMGDVVSAFQARLRGLSRARGGDGQKLSVASIATEYPEERILTLDAAGNEEKIRAVTSPQAITAAGGICAPLEVRYALEGCGTDERRVPGALAAFNAARGGIRFVPPPAIGDYDTAVGKWTVTNDEDAVDDEGVRKTCVRVVCDDEQTATLHAIYSCVEVGNFQARTYPEQIARILELVQIEGARFADTDLLTAIGDGSTSQSDGQNLGAARDILEATGRAAVAYRSRNRMSERQSLRAIFPFWVRDMIREDLTRGGSGSQDERLATADATIDGFFRARGINITYALDGEPGQVFGALVDGTVDPWPDTVVAYLFAEGSWLYLDGGELDLGVVRDSTLNARNDYQVFAETFETVAYVGACGTLRLEFNVCVSGEASAPTTGPCGGAGS